MEKDDGETGSSIAIGEGDAVDLGVHAASLLLFVTLVWPMVKGPFAIMLTGVYNSRRY